MKTELMNVSQAPRDLHTGRVLAPSETAKVEITAHEEVLIAAGHLLAVDTKPPRRTGAQPANDQKEDS